MQWGQVTALLLIFVRMTAFVSLAPFFSLRGIPALVKAAFGALLAILLLPAAGELTVNNLSAGEFVMLLAREALLGLALGYVSNITFEAIRVAGQFLDVEIGFSMATLLDPQGGSNVTLLGQLLYIIGLLLFLQSDSHHLILKLLADSFELIPLGGVQFGGNVVYQVVEMVVGMFALALRLAAPVLALLVLSDISLGLVARTVPQLNVFMLGFPIKSGLGMLILLLAMPLVVAAMGNIFQQLASDLSVVIKGLSGGM